MKYMVLIAGITIASVTNFEVTNNDTTHIKTYYSNGNMESKGMKVHKLKEGEWIYYTDKGFPYKIERYRTGRALKSLNLRDYSGASR